METDPRLPPGTRLAHYEVRRPLGSGAMGTVYEAHDTALDRTVAVKVLRARIADDPAVVERFVREARAAARVNHPNLTHIYFVGSQDGHHYFAMEHVPGRTLEAEVAERGPMDLARFVDVVVQAARGLAAAHGAGVIHRDVKPSNLMLLPDGTVKVTDFGLAKSLGGAVAATGGGSLMGTPTYMSPEQCRGRAVDARSDVYALGLVAWFLLAGRPPFAGESLGQVLSDQMNAPLPPIRGVRPEVPPALDAALARICEKDPARRPASMEEVARLIEPFRPRPLDLAPFMARATAASIDLGVCLAAAMALAFLRVALRELFPDALDRSVLVSTTGAAMAAVFLALHFGAEARFSRTMGKFLFNLGVVREDGTAPRRLQLLARFLLRWPAFAVFVLMGESELRPVRYAVLALQGAALLAGAACYALRGGRTLSDLVTRTRVVYRSSADVTPARAGGVARPPG